MLGKLRGPILSRGTIKGNWPVFLRYHHIHPTTRFEPFFDRVFAMPSDRDLELQLRQLILQEQQRLYLQHQEQLAWQHQELLEQIRTPQMIPPRTSSPEPSSRASNTSRDARISIRVPLGPCLTFGTRSKLESEIATIQ